MCSFFLPVIDDGEDKASPFKNFLRTNYRHLKKWAKRTQTNCFRLYDRELSNYPLAIDLYAGNFCVHYYAKSRDTEEADVTLVEEINATLSTLFAVDEEQIYWRQRSKNKSTRQYEKRDHSNHFFLVQEYGIYFTINLTDYLDTGLFLDHRETRQQVATLATNKKVLNLFAYTCSFSIHAAMAGATFTRSVDLSNTYCAWGRRNFNANSLCAKQNEILRMDCLKFLTNPFYKHEKYDLIIIDPPTISRSKKMDQLFDIQVDYVFLINACLNLLNLGGIILFSTNSNKFTFDIFPFSHCFICEITHKTIPLDFQRTALHRCWKIERIK